MLQRLGIRSKMLLTVAVPLLVLLLTGIGVVGFSWVDLSSARNAQTVVSALDDARDLGEAFTDERYYTVSFLDAIQVGRDEQSTAVRATNQAYADVIDTLAGAEDSDAADVVTSQLAAVVGSGDDLVPSLRAVGIETTEEGLSFPASDEATQVRLDYADVSAAVERLAISDAASATGTSAQLEALAADLDAEGLAARRLFTEPVPFLEGMLATWTPTERAIETLTASAQQIDDTDENAAVLARTAEGKELLEELATMRQAAALGSANSSTTLEYYSQLITLNLQAATSASAAAADADLNSRINAFGRLSALTESLEYEKIVVQRLILAGAFGDDGEGQLRELSVRADLSLDDAQAASEIVGSLDTVPEFASIALDGVDTTYTAIQTSLLSGEDSALIAARDEPWVDAVDAEIGRYSPLTDDVWNQILSRADSDVTSLSAQLLAVSGAVVAAFLIAVIVANAIARRIVNPLRRLTTTATAVRQELPRLVERVAMPGESVDLSEVQIPVESEDEVGRLAEAFNGVNAATLSIAAEQAALRGSISEMFVNVARRDQVLLNRQLASIDEMERSEDDPDTLTKLFALDHLATRMRRNSESLLVLAGIDTGRRLRRPMPLSDVIRTASSEIELYERIDLQLDADPQMVGHSALTTAHLFAELLENATVFSDPGSMVAVRTMATESGYVVEVADTGIGMNPEELHSANSRVSSHQASEILGAQRLGLFVVGRIARRIGAAVEITSTEGEGTTVSVALPVSLFDDRLQEQPALTRPSAMVADEVIENPLTGPAEAAGMARTAPASVDAYAPATVQEGAPLAGRGGELPSRGGLPTRGTVTATSDASSPSEPAPQPASAVEGLIREDAEAAPEGTAVDSSSLVEGATAAGLPARRRRAAEPASPSAPEPGGTNVIGLPQRATAEQLSALEGEAGADFTPKVSASEVAPQSAEQRAAMFRGFRSRRAGEVPPSAASTVDAFFPGGSQAGAGLEPIAPTAPTARSAQMPAETPGIGPTAGIAAAFAAGIARADGRGETPAAPASAETTGQSPLIQHGFGDPQGQDSEAPADTSGFVIPLLEDDEPLKGVESVSLVEEPVAPEQTAVAPQPYWEQQAPEAPAMPAPPSPSQRAVFAAPQAPSAEVAPQAPSAEAAQEAQRRSLFAPDPEPTPPPAVPAPVQQAQPEPVVDHVPAAPVAPQPEPVVSAPSPVAPPAVVAPVVSPAVGFDDLIGDESTAETERGGFFNRLFGRGRKAPASPHGEAADAGTAEPFVPTPAAAPAAFTPLPAQEPAADVQSASAQETEGQAAAFAPGAFPPASPTPAPTAPSPAPTSRAAEGMPTSSFVAPMSAPSAPTAESARAASAPAAPPSAPSAPAQAPSAPTSFMPAPGESFMPAETAGGGWHEELAAVDQGRRESESEPYSPDQLANPVGWEQAGASALEHAEPSAGYSPSFQINPEPDSDQGDQSDVASAVFSEFASFATERPKVQKTKAGLTKRERTKPVEEPKPLEAEVKITEAPRDADAVRQRFSSFYSGTQRARSDVAEYERQSQANSQDQA
ncbi:ATP-binding protein [Demequina sp. NBRC 110054]|uniref:ATP-binding protein n=1 Tax=Demequina sp. NBRC 110054 TaxID=1570343 RepID=UPI000A07A537|nr:ATP-binding protein [Demequina sp. NBRC 110054]